MEFCIGLFVGMVAGLVAGISLMWDQRDVDFEARRDAEVARENDIEQRYRSAQ